MLRNIKNGEAIEKITTNVEYETGRIIDGKIEYYKRINLGALPNAGEIQIQTNIGRNVNVTKLEGIATRIDGVHFPLPYSSLLYEGTIQVVTLNNGRIIQLKTSGDKTDCTAVVMMCYVDK